MTVLKTQLQPGSEAFEANRAAMQTLVDDLRATLERTALGGSDAARAKHTARGKLLVRERIDALLDAGSPFLEIAPLAAHGMYDDPVPGAGMVAGIGRVSGVECLIGANALIPEGKVIPDYSLVVGAPGRIVRQLTEEELVKMARGTRHYVENWQRYQRELKVVE